MVSGDGVKNPKEPRTMPIAAFAQWIEAEAHQLSSRACLNLRQAARG